MKKKMDEFVFRFDIYNGTEQSLQVYDSEVVAYKFVNQGTTIVEINSGLFLYPAYSGILPNEIELTINNDEMDVTVYNYEFRELDYMRVSRVIDNVEIPYIAAPTEGIEGAANYNQLLVISKVKATVETENP